MQENKNALSRGEIADIIHEKFGKDFQSRAAVDRVVAGVFDEIIQAVAEGRRVQIDRLGSFSVVKAAARTGRNPATREPIQIPEGQRIKYHASKAMKDAAKAAPAPVGD